MVVDNLIHDAEKIALLVQRTSTEKRGDLFYSVAEILNLKSQYYTATMFYDAARAYGRKEA